MRSSLLSLLLVGGVIGTGFVLAESEIPQQAPFSRYQVMLDKSPFAVATAVAAPAATPNFAKDLYVANAARTADGAVVTIASSTDKNFKKYLNTAAPVDGFAITNIEWSEKVGATRVTITKDGQVATLSFNQALLAQPAANAPPSAAAQQPPAANIPAAPGQRPQNFPRPAPIPSLPMPTPPPRVRGLIQKNPQQIPGVPTPAPNVTPDLPEE